MEFAEFNYEDVRQNNTEQYLRKRIMKGGRLLLKRGKANRIADEFWRDQRNNQKAQLNSFVKKLQGN